MLRNSGKGNIMKTSLSHLPKNKREDLKRIVETVREMVEPEMVSLFGTYTRGDWKDGPHQQSHGRLTIHKKSDYDILVI